MPTISADTVKVLFPIEYRSGRGLGSGWEPDGKSGLSNQVWWSSYRHKTEGLHMTLKGCGHDAWAVWEGSVPKATGSAICRGSEIGDWIRYLADACSHGEASRGLPYLGRVDACVDTLDPERDLLRAAVGWKPHARTKYTEAVYQGGQTVMLWNKRRAVRVYDKEIESQDPRFRDLVRLEYQLRSAWVKKTGLAVIGRSWDDHLDGAIAPIYEALRSRAGMES